MKNHFTKCLITGNEDLKPLKGYEDNYLVKSNSSGFIFCSKIPSDQELIEYYSNYPIGYGADSPLNIKRINERLDEFEQFRKTNKILDVGCGPGIFLTEAKKRGWDVYGTEFTDDQINYLKQKGVNTFQGKLNKNSFNPETFDVIISSEVIEHINNPLEEISNFNLFLRKGGLLYITTPNFNSTERFILKGNYNIITYPEHLCYYTPKTLDILLSLKGFKKLKVKTTGISLARMKNSKSNNSGVHGTELENDDHLRESLEYGYKRHIKNLVNWFLTVLKIGNSIKAYYIKS